MDVTPSLVERITVFLVGVVVGSILTSLWIIWCATHATPIKP